MLSPAATRVSLSPKAGFCAVPLVLLPVNVAALIFLLDASLRLMLVFEVFRDFWEAMDK
jgi:hypothetical protein